MSGSPPSSSAPEVVVYTSPGCSLCRDATELLEALRRDGYDHRLTEVDITTDPVLHRRYLERIPVVTVDGAVACELVCDPGELRRRLATLPP